MVNVHFAETTHYKQQKDWVLYVDQAKVNKLWKRRFVYIEGIENALLYSNGLIRLILFWFYIYLSSVDCDAKQRQKHETALNGGNFKGVHPESVQPLFFC